MKSLMRALFICLVTLPCLLVSDQGPSYTDDADLKKSVCLNMIVKNESRVIKRCLTSVLPFIDTWVIVDTGSTDGTQQVIKDFMQEHQVSGELHERPWVNFGANRQEALMLAKDKADYLLFIDADDKLVYSNEFELPDLTHDVYLIKGKDNGVQFHLWSLVKASCNWEWNDPIHEYIKADDVKEGAILSGIEYLYINDGARSRDPKKALNDLYELKKALKSDPLNKRMTYHLAQTYLNIGNLHLAIETYQKRVNLGGNEQEVFYAMLLIAKLQEQLHLDPEVFLESYQKALDFRPTRPEPIYHLARRARIENNYKKAYEISKRGMELPHSTDIFDLDYTAYDGILFEYVLSCLEVGNYQECKRASRLLSTRKDLSEGQIAQLKLIKESLRSRSHINKALKVVNKFYGEPS